MSNKIHPWLYSDVSVGKFLMLPPELLEEPAYQKLSQAARYFYIVLNVHRETEIQRKCLYNTLHDYNRILDLGMTDFDIENEATPRKHSKNIKGYFVAPLKHLEMYGYKKSYVTKLKKELIDNGFIRVVYGGKGKRNGWNENVTVYQFIRDWQGNVKQNPSTP